MKKSELKKLIGKTIRFKSNRTEWSALCPTAEGEVKEMAKSEVYVAGDWHEIKSLVVIDVYQ